SFIVIAIFAPLIAPFSPTQLDLNALDRNGLPTGPTWQHLMGIEPLGRDEFSRLLYGARISLVIGLVAVGSGLSLGLFFGSVAGYVGGFVDSLIMRVMD